MKTFLPKDVEKGRRWLLVDVADKPLGRVAAKIANLLRGKGKVYFTPHLDVGDFVVVINAEKVKLTGRKEEHKMYATYSGYRHGLKKRPAFMIRERHPDRMIKQAVKGMLPGNTMSRQVFRRLKVYTGNQHPHAAQAPVAVS